MQWIYDDGGVMAVCFDALESAYWDAHPAARRKLSNWVAGGMPARNLTGTVCAYVEDGTCVLTMERRGDAAREEPLRGDTHD